jgi:hypothetical protein
MKDNHVIAADMAPQACGVHRGCPPESVPKHHEDLRNIWGTAVLSARFSISLIHVECLFEA